MGTALKENKVLERISLANNNVCGDAAMVIADSLHSNEVIKIIDMSHNPVGQSGVRSLMGTMQTCTVEGRSIIVDGCSFQVNSVHDFDPKKANGNYRLTLEVPYEHAIAQEILTLARSLAPPLSMQGRNCDDADSSSSSSSDDDDWNECNSGIDNISNQDGSEGEKQGEFFNLPRSADLEFAKMAKVRMSKENEFEKESHNFEAKEVENIEKRIQVGKMGRPKTGPKSPTMESSRQRLTATQPRNEVRKNVYSNTEAAAQAVAAGMKKRRRLTAQQRGTLTPSQYKKMAAAAQLVGNAQKATSLARKGSKANMRKRSNVLIQAVFVEMYDKEQWCLENVKLNQKLVPHNGRSLAWTLPDEGVLEFCFNGSKMLQIVSKGTKAVRDAMRETGFSHIYRVVKKAMEKDPKEALQVVTSSADMDVYYTSTQAIAIAELFDRVSDARLEAVRYLFTRIVDTEKRDMLFELLHPVHQAQMQKMMGKIAQFNEENPTGSYYLDLEKPEDYNIALRLISINKDQVRKRRKRRLGSLPDLSQHSNWCAFRNLRFWPRCGQNFDELPVSIRDDIPEMVRRKAQQMGETPKPIDFMWDSTYEFPQQGILELDFVVWTRPPKRAQDMALRENGSDASKFDNIAFNNRFDTLVEALNLHRFAEEKCLWLRTVSTAFYFTSAQALELAQIVSKSDYLALLYHSLPGYVASAYLCEVLVFLFPRIVDLEEFISLVATLYPYEQITIRDRLGPLALLNPANPRGQWELDLESPDGNHVAAFFVYNKTFDGCKWENEMLNGHRFIMPTSWIQEILAGEC